jgi:hypothetical protein
MKITYPHRTDWSNRIVFIPEDNLHLVELDENSPRITLEKLSVKTLELKDFYKYVLTGLGELNNYSRWTHGELFREIERSYCTNKHSGLIVDRAEVLFEKRQNKTINSICTCLASLAQGANTQFFLIGNNSILKVQDAIDTGIITRTHWIVPHKPEDPEKIAELRQLLGFK